MLLQHCCCKGFQCKGVPVSMLCHAHCVHMEEACLGHRWYHHVQRSITSQCCTQMFILSWPPHIYYTSRVPGSAMHTLNQLKMVQSMTKKDVAAKIRNHVRALLRSASLSNKHKQPGNHEEPPHNKLKQMHTNSRAILQINCRGKVLFQAYDASDIIHIRISAPKTNNSAHEQAPHAKWLAVPHAFRSKTCVPRFRLV